MNIGRRVERTPLAEPRRRKERNSSETKRRILEAARAEFAAKGFDGARLSTIARAADVQQALIHHYYGDKERLHADVVRSGLAAMTEGVWELLARMDETTGEHGEAPKGATRRREKKKPASKPTKTKSKLKPAPNAAAAELRAVAEAFVELLLSFFATNGAFLSILRHEMRRGEEAAKIVADTVGPVFDGLVARIDAMRDRGEVKKDVDAKHLVLSCVAMVAFPFQEEPFVTAIWPVDWRAKAFLRQRKEHIVEMILARVVP